MSACSPRAVLNEALPAASLAISPTFLEEPRPLTLPGLTQVASRWLGPVQAALSGSRLGDPWRRALKQPPRPPPDTGHLGPRHPCALRARGVGPVSRGHCAGPGGTRALGRDSPRAPRFSGGHSRADPGDRALCPCAQGTWDISCSLQWHPQLPASVHGLRLLLAPPWQLVRVPPPRKFPGSGISRLSSVSPLPEIRRHRSACDSVAGHSVVPGVASQHPPAEGTSEAKSGFGRS